VAGLASSFADLVPVTQDPIHRRDRAQVAAFVEQDRPDLCGSEVAEPFAVQHGDDLVDAGLNRALWLMVGVVRAGRAVAV
jgi:hypothetical protein